MHEPRTTRKTRKTKLNGMHPSGKMPWFKTRRDQFADTYYGKVIRLDAARQIVSLKQSVDLRNLEKVIPYSAAPDFVIENQTRILALECPCRGTVFLSPRAQASRAFQHYNWGEAP